MVSLAWESPTKKKDFAGIVQVVELTHADKGISFFVKDNYTGKTKRYHWMELLLDEEVIWEADVAGGDAEYQAMSSNAKLLVVESVIPPGNEPFGGKFLELVILPGPGGKTSTGRFSARLDLNLHGSFPPELRSA